MNPQQTYEPPVSTPLSGFQLSGGATSPFTGTAHLPNGTGRSPAAHPGAAPTASGPGWSATAAAHPGAAPTANGPG